MSLHVGFTGCGRRLLCCLAIPACFSLLGCTEEGTPEPSGAPDEEPRTSGETSSAPDATPSPADTAWVRRALGRGKPLSAEERKQIEASRSETTRSAGRDTAGHAPEGEALEESARARSGAGASAATAGGLGGAPGEMVTEESRFLSAPEEPEVVVFYGTDLPGEEEDSAPLSFAFAGAPETARELSSENAEPTGGPDFVDLSIGLEETALSRAGRTAKATSGEPSPEPRLLAPTAEPRTAKVLFQNEEGKYEALLPRSLRVSVFIDGPRARTVVDQVFWNPHDRTLEGTFYYPLPADASPAAFGMFRGTARVDEEKLGGAALIPPLPPEVPSAANAAAELERLAPRTATASDAEAAAYLVRDWGELQVARVVHRERATRAYETIVRRNIDPALIEWSGANTFRARVFPLEGRSVKRLVLVYEETLPADGDLLRYHFALPDETRVGTVPVALHLNEGALELREVSGSAERNAVRTRTGGWTRRDLRFETGRARAVELALAPERPEAQAIAGPADPAIGGSTFFARVRPPIEAEPLARGTGRALFLVDTSLSEEGLRHGLSVELLEKVLTEDETIDEYAVLLFDLAPRWLHALEWRANDPEHRSETLAELRKVFLEGATSLEATLGELDRQQAWLFDGERPPHVFLLSDGHITWGQERVGELLRRHESVRAARWISYRFGNVPVNQELFDTLARVTTGRTVNVFTRGQLEAAAKAHRLASRRLVRVAVEGAEARDIVVAGEPALLFPGQELQVAGRIVTDAAPATLIVETAVGSGTTIHRYALASRRHSPLASRAWAELHARRLLALDDERLDRMVVALSQRFGLANRVASLLVLESEADYEEFRIEDEKVDLADLEELRRKEEDQRRDRLQGIALDEAPDHAARLVGFMVRRDEERTETQGALASYRPLAGGDERAEAERTYRDARAEDPLDIEVYDAIARVRALSGDVPGAVRAYSSLVEKLPASAEAARLVGYACLALRRPSEAADLFERVRLRRPFEPQSYLEEALALEAAGRAGEAARNYEIVLARDFPRHGEECRTTAATRYALLLHRMVGDTAVEGELAALARRRLAEVEEMLGREKDTGDVGLRLTTHWNTDSTDVDLWVLEPEGDRCYYSHRDTAAGGRLFWDNTTGYGPELYRRRDAKPGEYRIYVHYYGNSSPRWSVPTAVLLVSEPRSGKRTEPPEFLLRILPEEDAVVFLASEEL